LVTATPLHATSPTASSKSDIAAGGIFPGVAIDATGGRMAAGPVCKNIQRTLVIQSQAEIRGRGENRPEDSTPAAD